MTKPRGAHSMLTNSMEQSPSAEANSCQTSQEISRLLLNPKVHYHGYKNPLFVPILSQMNPVHTLPPFFLKIYSNVIYLRLDLREFSFHHVYQKKKGYISHFSFSSACSMLRPSHTPF